LKRAKLIRIILVRGLVQMVFLITRKMI